MGYIAVSTGDIKCSYQVIDTVCAIGDADKYANVAFDSTKEALRAVCASMGGDAVIFASFEYFNFVKSGTFGDKQMMQFIGYGTVIRYA